MRKSHPFAIHILFSIILSFSLLWGCNGAASSSQQQISSEEKTKDAQKEFSQYTRELFLHNVTDTTINLHYTLLNPTNYGIDSYPITLGELSATTYEQSFLDAENQLQLLKQFQTSELSYKQQYLYDLLIEHYQEQLALSDFIYYDEVLQPHTGFLAEFFILMAEYSFQNGQDVEDYLGLLADVPRYFDQILCWEQQRSKKGLFMPDSSLDTVIQEGEEFCKEENSAYLLTTFENRLPDHMDTALKESYLKQNTHLIQDIVLPAYQQLLLSLEELRGTGTTQLGLSYLPKGKEYYSHIVRNCTGSDKSVRTLETMVEEHRNVCLTTISELMEKNPNIASDASVVSLPQEDASSCLTSLIQSMQSDFPAPVTTKYELQTVDPCLQSSMAPAFYITAPMDDISLNRIYLNPASDAEGIDLFTTLAHEGFPGHLYQTTMSYHAGMDPLQSLLYYPGYTEGWATYVELISYDYCGIDSDIAKFLCNHQDAVLSLYASADMGIHYDGWNLSDLVRFFSDYGISDVNALSEVYDYILSEPGHYLKYYIGYLEILELKNAARSVWKDNFSELHFHQFLLEMGPGSFPVLKKYVTVQSQVDLSKKSDECLHSKALFCINLFGGYASPRKHAVFSRLALNSYKNI